jgi:hypothetical protein
MATKGDATVSVGGDGGAEAQAPGGTIGRFVVERTLGSGGMGVVIAARDPALERTVALKLLRSADGGEEGRARLQREAQAMARVQHPNVATVYEVGTVGDQLFVAMELVDGQTLKGWLQERPRSAREILPMMVAAGRGLAAVHGAGLTHRDFKPDNVLVGRDGRPRVSDFGLVSLRGGLAGRGGGAGGGHTISAAGTPAYMSPEQTCGQGGDLSDQFSFCVVLWEALFGERPFADDAAPEERHAPERVPRGRVPARLTSIVSRGLASRPKDRWPSMEALLTELERDTAPKPRRVALAVLALIGVVSLGGWLQSRYSAARRVERAAELGREAQQMRTMMRAAHLLPLHDIKPDRDKVRAIVSRIESQLPNLSGEVHAQAEAALGAGYFAINDRSTALKHLQAAWDAGQRSPEVAFDLGQALVIELQRQKLAGSEPTDPEEAKRRDEELKKKFRDPAIAILHQADGAADTSPEYLEEVIAWAERRTADVEKHGEVVFRESPTLYEAGLFVASAYARDAFFADQSGKGDTEALYRRADAMYKKVMEIGRSDEGVYRLATDHLSLLAYQRGHTKDTGAEIRAMTELCEKGRAADSEAIWPDEMLARLYVQLDFIDQQAGRDYERDQDDAIAAAHRALKRDPKAFKALGFLGMAWQNRAEALDDRGEDPQPAFESAIDAYTRSIAAGGAIDSSAALGQAKMDQARRQMARGLDPTATLEAGIKDYDEAARLFPADLASPAHRDECLILVDRARDLLSQGKDARVWLERAAPLCATAAKERAGEPDGVRLTGYLADAEALAAAQSGGDPLPSWQRAQPALEAAVKLAPKRVTMHRELVDLLAARAEYQSAHGHDARADVAHAIAEARQAIAVDPKHSQSYRALARAELAAVRAKKSSDADLKEGLAAVDRALAIKKNDGAALAIGVQLELAAHDKNALARGEALLKNALALNATDPRLLFFRSELERLSGDKHADDTRKEAFAAGPQLEAWVKAFAVAP